MSAKTSGVNSPDSRKVAICGAGAVGRGFVGPLFASSGWRVTFLDISNDLVREINRKGGYRQIEISNEGRRCKYISPVSGVNIQNEDEALATLVNADFAAICVGASNIASLAPIFVRAIRSRLESGFHPLDVLLCENIHEAPRVFRELLDSEYGSSTTGLLGLLATSIGRMIPRQEHGGADSLDVVVEPYAKLPYDASGLIGPVPEADGLIAIHKNFDAYSDRKLYVHNMGHCLLAYLAIYKNRKYIWEAVEDIEIRYLVRAAMIDSAAAINAVYGIPLNDLLDHVNDLIHRFGNRALGDTAARVGQDPVRKMQPNDRLLGALKICHSAGGSVGHVSLGVALGAWRLITDEGWTQTQAVEYLRDTLGVGLFKNSASFNLICAQLQLLLAKASLSDQIRIIDDQYRESQVI